jgi:hypothetical protein
LFRFYSPARGGASAEESVLGTLRAISRAKTGGLVDHLMIQGKDGQHRSYWGLPRTLAKLPGEQALEFAVGSFEPSEVFPGLTVFVAPGRFIGHGSNRWTFTELNLYNIFFSEPGRKNTNFVKGFLGAVIRAMEPMAMDSGFEDRTLHLERDEVEAGLPLRSISFIGFFPRRVVEAHSQQTWRRFDQAVRNPRDPKAFPYRARPWTHRMASGGILYRLADYETGERDMRLRALMRREFGVRVRRLGG